MKKIKTELNSFLNETEKSIQEVLFITDGNHPIWDDNLEIIQLASQQILQPLGSFKNEEIIAFIGMHAKTILSNKRDSIGLLITNYRILVQTDFTVIGKAEMADFIQFTNSTLVDEIYQKAINIFLTKNKITIPQEQIKAIQNALKNVLNLIIPRLHELNFLPNEIKKSEKVEDRIKELGLKNEIKTVETDEKLIKKFAEKFNIQNIKYAIIDKPFFSSPYGTVITENGITSRDLMEEPQTCTWNEIKNNPAALAEKNDCFIAGNIKHIIPSYQEKITPLLITLINEIAQGKISF